MKFIQKCLQQSNRSTLKVKPIFLFISFMVYTSILGSNATHPEIVFPKLYPDLRTKGATNTTIFFGLVSMPSDIRQDFTNAMWLREINEYSPHEGVFLCAEGRELPGVGYLHPSKEDYKIINVNKRFAQDRDRAIKRYIGAKYFYEKTNHDWYWTATDDLYIDIPKLHNLMKYLESNFDSRNDIVFKGHTIYNMGIYYLQGGVGYILSRKAVKKFLEFGIDFIKNINTYDDCATYDIRKMFNLTIEEMSTHYLYGQGFSFKNLKKPEQLNHIYGCPREFPLRGIYDYAAPMNDLVAYHSIYQNYDCYRTLKIAEMKNPRLHYYFNHLKIIFCNK